MMIGIDAHKLSESVCVTDDDGNIMEEYSMNNTDESWRSFMEKYRESNPKIAVESSTTGKYVARLLRDHGFEVHLANPKGLKIIYGSGKKTDRNDARNIAKLLRLGELPESYLPSMDIDEIRTIIRYRRSLGEEMTAIKNSVHSLLTRNGITIKASDIFGKRSLDAIIKSAGKLSVSDSIVLTDLMNRLQYVRERIERMQDKLASMGRNIPEVKILMTIPGIDYYSALAIYSEIGDITRFPDADHLASYTGLVPRVNQSGSVDIHGHITKSGPSVLRFFLVNSTHTLIKLSASFKNIYRKLRKRIGKNRAIIAVARKLAVVIFNMLARKQCFVDDHWGRKLYERKLKAMESRGGRSKEFRYEDMERIIGMISITSQSTKLLS